MNGKVENVNARFNSKLGKITVQGLLKLQRCAGKIYSISIKDPETLLQWYITLTITVFQVITALYIPVYTYRHSVTQYLY